MTMANTQNTVSLNLSLKRGMTIDIVGDVVALFVIIWGISPPLQMGTTIRMVAVLGSVFWLFYALMRLKSLSVRSASCILGVFVFCFIILFFGLINDANILKLIIRNLHLIVFLFYLCIGIFYLEVKPKLLENAYYIAISLLTIFCLITFRAYQSNPYISRMLVHSPDFAADYARRGVGGYGLVYTSIFAVNSLLYRIVDEKTSKTLKMLFGASIAIMSLTIFSSSFFIANIILFTFIASFGFKLYSKDKKEGVLLFVIVFSFLCLSVYLVIVNFGDAIKDQASGSRYYQKICNVIDYANGWEVEGSLNGRVERYDRSWDEFVAHPFLGRGIVGGGKIGGHSALLDIVAYYGIIFSLPYFYSIFVFYGQFLKHRPKFGYFFISIFGILFLGVFNTYVLENGVGFFILIPAACIGAEEEAK